MSFLNNMALQSLATILIVMMVVAVHGKDEWRTDNRYTPWTMEGRFILGTPPTCEAAPEPEHGRWVCSYGLGENGRSLCIVDCQQDYVIEGKPLIFNCDNGMWKTFPTQMGQIDVPWGKCIHNQVYLKQYPAVEEKRSEMDEDISFAFEH